VRPVTIFFISKNTFAVFNKPIDKKAKRNKREAKTHISLCKQFMRIEVIARCKNGDGYQEAH